MKTFTKSFIQKALTYDDKISNDKWIELQKMIRESGVDIKHDRDCEMFLSINGERRADIELYPLKKQYNGEFVHVQLWYYEFEAERLNQIHLERSHNFSGIASALGYVNRIFRDVKMDNKLRD